MSQPTFGSSSNQNQDFQLLSLNGFQIEAIIGTGGFGVVYEGHYNQNIIQTLDRNYEHLRGVIPGQRFAAKYMNLLEEDDPEDQYLNRVFAEREKQCLGIINHPNLITIKMIVHLGEQTLIEDESGHFYSPDRMCFIMDLADRGDLNHFVQNNALDIVSAKTLCFHIALGLKYLHDRDVIHGDIKATNVLLFTENGRIVPKLCDFGFSQVVTDFYYFYDFYENIIAEPVAKDVAKHRDIKGLSQIFRQIISSTENAFDSPVFTDLVERIENANFGINDLLNH